jgi:hypothetical protein
MLPAMPRWFSALGVLVVGAWLGLLGGCPSSTPRVTAEPQPSASAPAAPAAWTAIARASASAASPVRSVEPPEANPRAPGIHLHGVDVHLAAALVRRALRIPAVLVVGDVERQLNLTLSATSPKQALQALATAAEMRLTDHDGVYWLTTPAILESAGRVKTSQWPGGRGVDLRLHRARLSNVIKLLSEITGTSVTGGLQGELSLYANDVKAPLIFAHLLAASGAEYRRRGSQLIVISQSPLPPEQPNPDGGLPEQRKPQRAVQLPDAPFAQVQLGGVAALDTEYPVALLVAPATLAGKNENEFALVLAGMWVGAAEKRAGGMSVNQQVTSITRTRVRTNEGRIIRPLAPPAR